MSPDGPQLAFIARDGENIADLYTINANGSGLTRLTHDLGATIGVSRR